MAGHKPSSRSSNGSVASNASLGIGTTEVAQVVDPTLHVKLHPEGHEPSKSVYDCMMFIIYCEVHEKIAVTQVSSDIVWFPFVAREGRNWKKVAADGLVSLLSSAVADDDMIPYVARESDKSFTWEVCRVQDVNQHWNERVTQLILLENCTKTCEPVNNIIWMGMKELSDTCDSIFWGPEFAQFFVRCQNEGEEYPLKVVEYNVQHIIRHISSTSSADLLASLFESCNVGADILYDLYADYLKHSYPAYFMGRCNFRVYLKKLGFSGQAIGCKCTDEVLLTKAIFQACLRRPKRTQKVAYLEFLDVCYAVVAMDPKTPTEEPRARFLFDFYDLDGDGILNKEEIARLNKDNDQELNLGKEMKFNEFRKAIKAEKLPKIESICRLAKSVLTNLVKGADKSTSSGHSDPVHKHKSNRTRFICAGCRVKKFEHGQHCVTIDLAGRSVESNIILNCEDTTIRTDLTGKYLYSMECSFSNTSLGHLMFDYVRNRKFNFDGDGESQQEFFEQFKMLSDHVAMLVKVEPKIVKRQSPAIVIGDLQGSLESLLAMDVQLWRTIPVIGDDLIFLGNFTGSTTNSSRQAIEVLAYLFAIKYICPNKVVLLRGIQETRAFNEKTLLKSCITRFGKELGQQFWKTANGVFEQLPYISVVNEWAVCASSGIPKDSVKQRLTQLFDNVSKECATLVQVMTNSPTGTESGKTELFTQHASIPSAFTFSSSALRKFLDLNQYNYLIRSNERVQEGIRVRFNRRCITIDSNNAESQDGKKAVVVAIGHPRSKIHFIEIEHQDNQ